MEIPLQKFWIDTDIAPEDVAKRNQRRCDCQSDWQLLWEKDFIFAGCNGGIYHDIHRLEEIIQAAQTRLAEYNKRIEK